MAAKSDGIRIIGDTCKSGNGRCLPDLSAPSGQVLIKDVPDGAAGLF